MTDNNHPIRPPHELVEQWRTAPEYASALEKLTMVTMTDRRLQEIATQAARWGADQELDACCEWLSLPCPSYGRELRNARRVKLSNLKDQVREIIECLVEGNCVTDEDALTLRRTLDFLPWES